MKKTLRGLVCLMLCAMLLSSCASQSTAIPSATLPPASPGPQAPIGDAGLQREVIVPLYLPSLDGQSLLAFYEPLIFPQDQHPAGVILQALFTHPGNSRVQPLCPQTTLTLYGSNPIEISGGVCTVNLSANALQLSSQDLYTVALAITATLCDSAGVSYVNLLISGVPVAMDVGGNLPLGALNAPVSHELPILWEQFSARRTPAGEFPAHAPLTAAATLYFPLADGSGIVSEPRRISFPGQHPQQQVIALLTALSGGPDTLTGVCSMPDLNAMMLFAPEITDLESGGRRATLHFTADVEQRLLAAGCDPAATFAAVVTTLTTFVPSLQQICILVGDGALTSLYSSSLGSMLFPGGLMNRSTFAHALKDQTTIYLPDSNGLRAHTLSLPYRSAVSPRALLLAMASPEHQILPAPLTDADILGLAVHNGTLLIHFSQRYGQVIESSDCNQRLMVYSMVNTLCELLNVRRVRIYFGGEAVDSLGSPLLWSGEFLYNPNLIVH